MEAIDVNSVVSATLTPNGSAQLDAGGSEEYLNTLTNTGNSTETFSVSSTNTQGTWSNTVAIDTDGDGVADTELANLTTGVIQVQQPDGTVVDIEVTVTGAGDPEFTLDAGESLPITATVFAPATAPEGQVDVLTISAININSGDLISAQDQSQVIAGKVRIEKFAAIDTDCDGAADTPFEINQPSTVEPGQCVIWQIVAENQGSANALNVQVFDEVPAFTTFEAGSLSYCINLSCTPVAVSDVTGDDEGEENAGAITFYIGAGANPAVGDGGELGAGTKARLLVLLSFCVFCMGAFALTAPGTVIFNRAEISYQNEVDADKLSVISNKTTVTVGHLYSFSVENTHQFVIEAGSVAQFPHRVKNQGNSPDNYKFSFSAVDPDMFITPEVYLDVNSNGEIDPNEPLITETTELAPDAHVDVIVSARVSHLLTDGDSGPFDFVVGSVKSNELQQVQNEITVGSSGKLKIALRSYPACTVSLFPNDVITHSVDIHNNGSLPLMESDYLLNGLVVSGLLVELPLEASAQHLSFVEDDQNAVGIAVVKLAGFADNEWISAESIDVRDYTDVVSTGFLLEADSLVNSEVSTFTVQRAVNADTFGQPSSMATAYFDFDSNGLPDIVSNSTCSKYTGAAAAERSLLFIEPVAAVKDAGRPPDFYTASNFEPTDSYQLKRSDNDPYVALRDGVYLQLKLAGSSLFDAVSTPASTDPHQPYNGPSINVDQAGNRYVVVNVTSQSTSDSIYMLLRETSNPDVFRSIVPITLSATVRADGGYCPYPANTLEVIPAYDQVLPACVLQSADEDILIAFHEDRDLGSIVSGEAYVKRPSTVFDSNTLAPVPGATVEMRATVDDLVVVDELSGVSYSFVTDSAGRFPLPPLQAHGQFYMHVTPPQGYRFPSVIAPEQFNSYNVQGISYGQSGYGNKGSISGVFTGASINAQGTIDVPLDRTAVESMLVLDKNSTQSVVQIGESVQYNINVRNLSDETVKDVRVEDKMPFGFRYIPGSAISNGNSIGDPVVGEGGVIVFSLEDLVANETADLKYALRATAAAIDSNGVNSAIAKGRTVTNIETQSQGDKARVKIQRGGVFSDQAVLLGKVFVDQNCDSIQNNREWPIGGVRLYLQDGTYVTTDHDGMYSLYGLDPGQYVIKIDKHTLPKGLDLKLLAVDQAADAESYFVKLTSGDFHRADFATGCPKSDQQRIFSEIKARNKALGGNWSLRAGERITGSGSTRRGDSASMGLSDGDLSNGMIDGPFGDNFSENQRYMDDDVGADIGAVSDDTDHDSGEVDQFSDDELTGLANSRADKLQKPAAMLDAKQIVSEITSAQAKAGTWLWPRTDMSLNGRFMAVVRAGIDPTLYVNGVAVPKTQIGERMVNRREKAQVVAWYGIELAPGENELEVKGTGPFGNERVLAKGVFKRPSSGTSIELAVNPEPVAADSGRSVVPVVIKILDKNGYPALGVYYVTLKSSDGSWVEKDIQDSEPGKQIRVEGGQRTVYYRTSGITGEVQVRVSTGDFSADAVVQQTAELRPLLVSGFIQSGAYFTTEEIGNFSPSTDLGHLRSKGRFDTRMALFVTGTVKDKYNLTLSYDNKKRSNGDLFRDVDPMVHYPIFGDSSIKGFQAQSRSKLYVRVERDKSSAMWGDYQTDPDSDQRDLARMNRSLTGFNSVLEKGKNKFRLFAARGESRNLVEEIPGNGSALLYRLARYPIVPNSETVELVTRSRDNPGLIVESVRLSRFGDYSLDDDLGYLSFSSTVPTLDADQNPVFIRVSYDVEKEGEGYLIYGARFTRTVNERLEIGASISADGHNTEGQHIVGVYGDYKVGRRTRLTISVAASDSQGYGSGNAHRVDVSHQWTENSAATTSFSHSYASSGFNNVAAGTSAGRREIRVQHSQPISDKTRLLVEGNHSSANSIDEKRTSVSAVVETSLAAWELRAGLRRIAVSTAANDERFLTTILGARRKFKLLGKPAQTDIEYEQDTSDTERRRVAVGSKVQLNEKNRVYANYEISNSLLGLGGTSGDLRSESFTTGVESRIFENTRLYSEYRMRGAFESRDYETASGVRGDYEVVDGLRVSPFFEYVKRIGAANEDSIAASVAVADTRSPNSRRFVRLETRHSLDSDHYALRASIASKINLDWTGMAADNLTYQKTGGSQDSIRHTFTAALARRPKHDNRHHMLFMYKLRKLSG